MKGLPLGPGGEDITWPDQVAPGSRMASSSRKIKLRTFNVTYAPPRILPPALKRWGSPRQQGVCTRIVHLWAASDTGPRSEAAGTPQAAGFM